MSLASSSSRVKICVALICICCFSAAILLIFGLIELYKSNEFIIRRCQVKSVDVKFAGRAFYPRWMIMIVDGNQRSNHLIVSSTGIMFKSSAFDRARKYQINQSYPCYHSRSHVSLFKWGWQWEKPSTVIAYSLLFIVVVLIAIVAVLLILRRNYQKEFQSTEEPQQELEIPLRNEVQQETIERPVLDNTWQFPVSNQTKT